MKRLLLGLILLTLTATANAQSCKDLDSLLRNVKVFIYSLEAKLPKIDDSNEKLLKIYEEKYHESFDKEDFRKLSYNKDYLLYVARKELSSIKEIIENLPTRSVSEEKAAKFVRGKNLTQNLYFNNILLEHIDNSFKAYVILRDSTDAVEAASKLDTRLKSITETDPYQWSFSKGVMFSNITRLHSCYVEQLLTVPR